MLQIYGIFESVRILAFNKLNKKKDKNKRARCTRKQKGKWKLFILLQYRHW